MNPQEIKDIRAKLRLTQKQMVKALGVTCVMTYSKWETGERTPSAAATTSIKMLAFMGRIGVMDDWMAIIEGEGK